MDTERIDRASIIAALTARAREAVDLPPKAQAFCVHYVLENVGSHAALAAGYSDGSQHSMAAHWLRDRRAVALIRKLRSFLPDLQPIDQDAIKDRMAKLAMTEAAGLLVPDERYPDADPPIYRYKRPDELTPGERALIQDVRVTTRVEKDEDGNESVRQTFEYKLLNTKEPLDSLARTHGMFRDRVEHEHRHKVEHLFKFIAEHPETSETVAILNHRYGRGTMIEGKGGKK